MWVLNVFFWLFFAFTFFMVVQQLMYQEHSLLFSWYKNSPGFHVMALMVVFWTVVAGIACIFYHEWRTGISLILIAAAWLIFFVIYNRVIEMDVEDKIIFGDLPDSSLPL
uniref:Uncharacterized protein n=1 Tax=Burkholderia phage vB_BgluM-SURPRISE13 TaxID=3159457 RepID=A0AAU7PFE7_9VIRU